MAKTVNKFIQIYGDQSWEYVFRQHNAFLDDWLVNHITNWRKCDEREDTDFINIEWQEWLVMNLIWIIRLVMTFWPRRWTYWKSEQKFVPRKLSFYKWVFDQNEFSCKTRTPDLSLCDYFLFPRFKGQLRGHNLGLLRTCNRGSTSWKYPALFPRVRMSLLEWFPKGTILKLNR